MSKGFLGFSLLGLLLISPACGGGAAENAEPNINQNAAAQQNAAQTNVNAASNAESDEVPQYDNAETALAEGDKFFDASENDKAIDAYRQAVTLDQELAEAHFKLGVAYALVEKEEVTTSTPEDEPTPAKGKVKKNKKEEVKKTNSQKSFENAIKSYEKIVKKDPKNDLAFFNLGRAYGRLDEDIDALKALQTAVKLKPDDGDYQTELGDMFMKLAQYDEAIRAFKKALEIDENNLIAVDRLEQAQAGKKRVDFGANMIKPKIRVEPTP